MHHLGFSTIQILFVEHYIYTIINLNLSELEKKKTEKRKKKARKDLILYIDKTNMP